MLLFGHFMCRNRKIILHTFGLYFFLKYDLFSMFSTSYLRSLQLALIVLSVVFQGNGVVKYETSIICPLVCTTDFILFSWRKFAFSVYQYFSVKSDTVNSYLSAFGLFLLYFSHAVDRYFLVLLAGCSVTALLSAGNRFAH